jgi:hypothetical protein
MMGLFDRLRKPARTCRDSVFGDLTYEHPFWTGHVPFPPTNSNVMVMVRVEHTGSEPTEEEGALFSELLDRYAAMTPAIATALFSLWEPYLNNWGGDAPAVVTVPDQMLRYSTLDYVELGLPANIVLGYGFTEEVGWADAVFSVNVVDWQVSAGSLDD